MLWSIPLHKAAVASTLISRFGRSFRDWGFRVFRVLRFLGFRVFRVQAF